MISVVNHSKFDFSVKNLNLLKRDLRVMVAYLATTKKKPSGNITLALVDKKDIQTLNRQYLKHNSPTDILTFNDPEQLPKLGGDIALCPVQVLYYAFQDGREPVNWFQQTMLHGVLHIYGLKHNYTKPSLDRVYREQERIIKQVKLSKEVVNGIYKTIIQYQG